MKNILILGAGMVARPLLRYLLAMRDVRLLVASADPDRANVLLDGHPHGRSVALDVADRPALERLVADADIVVSLPPAVLNPGVARVALDHGKSLVNTSYVAPAMAELDAEARRRGVLLLNEVGLDPGIDHMSAVRMIHHITSLGGKVTHFTSCCGGFPAPDANTNPWGYKFSWSPRAVILAGRNPARYLRNGEVVEIAGGAELFGHVWPYEVEGQGVFEMYPNRDSLKYIAPYGLDGISGIFRGTLRYPGWCETMRAAAKLGLFEIEERDWPAGTRYVEFLLRLLPPDSDRPLVHRLAEFVGVPVDSEAIARLEWAGLLSDRPLPERRASPLDIFGNRLSRLMVYKPGERDMVALRHTFRATYPDGHTENLTSSLVLAGEPFGDTAMARTVGLPAAIATNLVLRGEVGLHGVHIPTSREIYEPVLDELEDRGVHLLETRTTTYPGPFTA